MQTDPLHKTTVSVITNNACQHDYNYADTPDKIKDSNLCAYTQGKDACQGDSGGGELFVYFIRTTAASENLFIFLGGLMVQSADGSYTLAGVISYGFGCGWTRYPGIYARLTSGMPWILQNAYQSSFCWK